MIIADSSGLISLFIETDENHTKAVDISLRITQKSTPIIIPGEIFSELVNILGKKFDHKRAFAAAESILESPMFIIQETTDQTRQFALRRFKDQSASVSFTDCGAMATADEYKVKEIFGFDKAFLQNGYKTP